MQRRRFLRLSPGVVAGGWALGGAGGLAGCATWSAPDPERLIVRQVAPGVWMWPGAMGDATVDNVGRTGNAGFLVGPHGVLMINSGVSHAHGQALLRAVRAVTARPIRGLLLTHAMQDFLFGATAFQAAGVPVFMHRQAARLMRARCDTCLRALKRELGDGLMADTRVPTDVIGFDAGDAASVLPDIGRPYRALSFGASGLSANDPAAVDAAQTAHSASPGQVAVLDGDTRTLFAGALMDFESVPDVQDADLAGWRTALTALAILADGPLARIVPGRGPLATPALIAQTERYLTGLEARTAALLNAGVSLSDIADAVQWPEFAAWARYESTHRRNAAIVFLRQERALMLSARAAPGRLARLPQV